MAAVVSSDDTIVALATVPGRSALAVVRLSGPQAHAIAEQVLDRPLKRLRYATRVRIRDRDGRRIDDAIAIRYAGPGSYTGEDAVEFICHGGIVTPAGTVRALVEA